VTTVPVQAKCVNVYYANKASHKIILWNDPNIIMTAQSALGEGIVCFVYSSASRSLGQGSGRVGNRVWGEGCGFLKKTVKKISKIMHFCENPPS